MYFGCRSISPKQIEIKAQKKYCFSYVKSLKKAFFRKQNTMLILLIITILIRFVIFFESKKPDLHQNSDKFANYHIGLI